MPNCRPQFKWIIRSSGHQHTVLEPDDPSGGRGRLRRDGGRRQVAEQGDVAGHLQPREVAQVRVRGDVEHLARYGVAMLDGLELFAMGASWGGFESLILPAKPVRTATTWDATGSLISLHVGLEHPDDLIADLEAGFARLGAAAG